CGLDLRVLEVVDSRAICRRLDAHSFENGLPARAAEELVDAFAECPVAFEELDAFLERVGQRDVAAPAPECRIVSLRPAVVQDDEISYFFEVRDHAAVVLADKRRIAIAVGEVAQEEFDAARDEVDRRGFERLDETGGEAER